MLDLVMVFFYGGHIKKTDPKQYLVCRIEFGSIVCIESNFAVKNG
jgi:hypothetical protein